MTPDLFQPRLSPEDLPKMFFAIKAAVGELGGDDMVFAAQKTMYGGKDIRCGDTAYLFASKDDRVRGFLGRGVVVAADAVPRIIGAARQTPRVNVTLRLSALAGRSLGRTELKSYTVYNDGEPAAELNFKLYRQATDKIVGISGSTATYLDGFLQSDRLG